MTMQEIQAKVEQLRELETMKAELDAPINSIKDELRNEMLNHSEQTLIGTNFQITYQPVTSHRVDTKMLQATYPAIAQACTKVSTSYRLTVK